MDRPLRILYITSLSIVPAYSGGPVRVYNILRQLAKHAELTFINPLSASVIRADPQCGPELRSVRILSIADDPPPPPRTISEKIRRALRHAHRRYRQRFWRHSPFGVTCMPLYDWLHLIDRACADARPDFIIFEQCWHLETLRFVRKKYPDIRCILSAQNVKTVLFEQALSSADPSGVSSPYIRRYIRFFQGLESSLHRYVDVVWTCSEHDRSVLAAMNRRHPLPMTVVANGVDPQYFAFDDRPGKPRLKHIIYGGTLCWPPSAEAVRYFHQQVWPLIRMQRPDLRFIIIGRQPPSWMRDMVQHDASVDLIGEVPDARPYFRDASVFVCPILSGSGTRLKILEAMSMGNPVVSTTLGAQGLAVQNGEQLLIADTPETFAQAVVQLAGDAALFDRIRHAANRFVEERYEWSHLTKPAIESLIAMTERRL